MEDVVLDVTDLYAGVLCCRAVLEQRFEPGERQMKKEMRLRKQYALYIYTFTVFTTWYILVEDCSV